MSSHRLRCYLQSRLDLLSVDVEGLDFETVKGLNRRRYRPCLIVIEMHGFVRLRHRELRVAQY